MSSTVRDPHQGEPLQTEFAALGEAVGRLARLMHTLRSPGGCPWDREQTLDSLRPYLLEEAYEVLHALEKGNDDEHREELGDLLLQIIFQSELRSEEGKFTLEDVANAIYDKLVRRHPHVFGDSSAGNSKEAYGTWEQIKAQERKLAGTKKKGTLDGVPDALPALLRAYRIGEKASSVGFDWSDEAGALEKLREEMSELQELIDSGSSNPKRLEDEFGDLLFSAVNIARHLKIDPEAALRGATFKFQRRFKFLEETLNNRGSTVGETDLESLEVLWNQAKAEEKQ